MAHYIAPYYLNWLASKHAEENMTIHLHTGIPGNNGTANRMSSSGGSNYPAAGKAIPAAQLTASGASVSNPAAFDFFTPNATIGALAEAQRTISHLSYFFGSNFIVWVDLSTPYILLAGTPARIPAGLIAGTFAAAT